MERLITRWENIYNLNNSLNNKTFLYFRSKKDKYPSRKMDKGHWLCKDTCSCREFPCVCNESMVLGQGEQ